MRYSSIIIYISIICICSLSSCKKYVEIPIPKNQLTTQVVFGDSAGATSAILGIYIDMKQYQSLTIANGGVTVYTGMTADELNTTSVIGSINEFSTNAITKENGTNQNELWGFGYKLIYEANACIEGINNSEGISNALKSKLIAECKMIRGFIYFSLVNLYGEVPIITSTDYTVNQKLPRSSVATIYDLIISDLKEAVQHLPINYISAGKLRPNQYAVKSVLAKVYLYLEDWDNAEKEASDVINSGIYGLESDLNNVFLANSSETVWELESILSNIETLEGAQLIPRPNRRPTYPIRNELINSFEPNDLRKTLGNWVNRITVGGVTYHYPYKYKRRTRLDPATVNEHYIMLRLAEQYLIRAESRAQLGQVVGANSAESDLNMIRTRSGLPFTTATTQATMLAAIYHERQVELFCEWGNRWFDLKRWGIADSVLSSIKADWQPTDVLYPIPQAEINNNPSLTQNSGY